MPALHRLRLEVDRPEAISPRHLRATVSRLIETDAEHHVNVKAFSVTPLHVDRGRIAVDVGLLSDEAEARLVRGLQRSAGRAFRMGGAEARVLPVPGTTSSWTEVVTRAGYHDLHHGAAASSTVTFDFLTPTVFRQGRQGQLPFPLPGLVFGHLRTRWNTFAPAGLHVELDLDALGLAVVELELSSAPMHDEHRRPGGSTVELEFVGFVGRVGFRARAGGERLRRLHALAGLATFSGIGANTTIGMGVTRAVPAAAAPPRAPARPPVGANDGPSTVPGRSAGSDVGGGAAAGVAPGSGAPGRPTGTAR